MTRRPSRHRSALRRRLPVRLIIIVATLFAFPWLPLVLLAGLAVAAFMVLSVVAALAYAAVLWIVAHAVTIATVATTAATVAGALQVAGHAKRWGELRL